MVRCTFPVKFEPCKGENEGGFRGKDCQRHFFCLVLKDGSLWIYCKQCKAFHRLDGAYIVEKGVVLKGRKKKPEICIRVTIN